ncbi:MAG: GntR family transcriptional regulator [Lachnospirales bacterium]
MLQIIIQSNSSIPVYEQIINQVKSDIFDGTLKTNEQMPSVRSLAKDIRVSALTVKKAYDVLESDGFIKTVHGKGSYVLPINTLAIQENILYQAETDMENLINKYKKSGVTTNELKEIFKILTEEE